MTAAADRAAIDRWWGHFVASGTLPAELELVQGRLVRSVHRGSLPSGPVHVKAMTFPRGKDRLRYALRALPAAHEAAMLRAVAAAGVACPDVVDARTARRRGLPFRSLLVVRTLPLASPPAPPSPADELREQGELALRLLAHGIVHRDLHAANFVRLQDGTLAVLDLQSASLRPPRAAGAPGVRVATAARLARERPGLDDAAALAVLAQVGLVRGERERVLLRARLAADRARFRRTRVARCFAESSEYTTRLCWTGREFRRRTALPDGRWCALGDRAGAAWVGQRVLQLDHGREPVFPALFRKWWWLGGGGSLYVPATCSDARIEREVGEAAAGAARLE
jgi:tRNA A-37 threonylcarbamoyl transferase component Bud32